MGEIFRLVRFGVLGEFSEILQSTPADDAVDLVLDLFLDFGMANHEDHQPEKLLD